MFTWAQIVLMILAASTLIAIVSEKIFIRVKDRFRAEIYKHKTEDMYAIGLKRFGLLIVKQRKVR